jgi:very-short-patch-repair endonuclease
MPIPEHAVRAIHDIPSLLQFLERELQWKLPQNPTVEEVTFEWSASELRLNEAAQSKLKDGTVLQIKKMADDQPWGIFIVNFTDGQVYKTALRQVLRGLVPKRRRDSNLPAWKHENILFICTTANQQFTFAHFKGEKPERAKLVRFSWSPDEPIRTLCEFNLPALKMPEDTSRWTEEWQKAFDVEAVTKQFYNEIANWYFWARDHVRFPKPSRIANADAYKAQSLIRLITRLIFCWFVKKKGLIPDDLFDLPRLTALLKKGERLATSKDTIYYKAILQNLFFATLNQEMEKRQFRKRNKDPHGRDPHHGITNLYRYEDAFVDPKAFLDLMRNIPFLNGGLFECLDKVYRAEENLPDVRIDGFSDHPKNPLSVPDFLFFGDEREVDLSAAYGEKRYRRAKVRGLIHTFSRYNFTVTENTPLDQEVALDPELAGKVFENLLAAYNPETATTARKATGSYYTPREIVNYMVDESLIAYLGTKLRDLSPALSKGEGVDLTPGPSPEERGEDLSPSPSPNGEGNVPPRYMTTDAKKWKYLKPLAREHRKNPTEAENILWQRLRKNQLGVHFRRQHAIDWFIADFVCIEKKLVVEVDGEIHKEQREYDAERTEYLNAHGFRVIRFWNNEVIRDADGVIKRIRQALDDPTPFPSPLGRGAGEGSVNDLESKLRHLFAYNDEPHQFTKEEVRALIAAIDNLKALDPACGSGAFPMGLLHRLVFILGKLDPHNELWKLQQIAKASEIPDATVREKTLEDIEKAFAAGELDYGRKLYLIENCIYGVDIQPIAVQIAKMRFFISLVVDQKVLPLSNGEGSGERSNRGIRPLPNLETKFVAANTLIGIEKPAQMVLRNPQIDAKEAELRRVRERHFTARTPATKARCREQDAKLRAEISALLQADGFPRETTEKLARWDPYDQNASADFFDPEWMFGIRDGFDVVIGNPPYGVEIPATEMRRIAPRIRDTENSNSAALFIDVAKNILTNQHGVVSFVVPKSLLYSERWFSLVKALAPNTSALVDLEQAFENVLLEQVVFVFRRSHPVSGYLAYKFRDSAFKERAVVPISFVSRFRTWPCDVSNEELRLGTKISASGLFLRDVSKSFRGFPLQQKLVSSGKFHVIGGKNIVRYGISGFKGCVRQPDLESVGRKVSALLQPKVISQQIVAHIQNPSPHIMIIASVDPVGDVLALDTVENTIAINDAIHLNMIAALFNSRLINWYAYRFIYCAAVRTMHFDEHYIGKIPLPTDYKEKQQPIIRLVDKILAAKRANLQADVSAWEREIDQLVYKLYGLTEEEIKIVEGR